ncbi:Platelet-activating factor acetylhydrolase [Blomia tropicalis]|nr:Platelet-activating factor acetylhydrolase [Blomia tropicalis]
MSKTKVMSRLRDAKLLKTNNRWHIALPTGPFRKIGCRDLMVGYSRKGGVLVRLYYPAKEDGKVNNPMLWANWLPHEYYKQGYLDVAGLRSPLLRNLLERINSKKAVFIPAIRDAKLAAVQRKLPVVVFSHGLGACRTTYSSICCELASHGFVVAAVEHRDNSACLSFYARRARYDFRESNPNFFHDDVDGSQAKDKANSTSGEGEDQVDADDEVDFGDEIDDPNYVPPKALSPITSMAHLEMAWVRHRYVPLSNCTPQCYKFRNRQIHHRVRECTRALDLLEALNAGYELENLLDPAFNKSEFENQLDLDRAVIMGHSMGGATALMTAAAELRFKVAVALDAWAFPIKDEPLDLIPQPVLMLNTETMVKNEANRRKLSEIMNGDHEPDHRQSYTINGSTHFQQCDIPFTMGWLALFLTGNSIGRTGVTSFTVHDLCTAMSLEFIYKHMRLDSNPILSEYIESKRKRFRVDYK